MNDLLKVFNFVVRCYMLFHWPSRRKMTEFSQRRRVFTTIVMTTANHHGETNGFAPLGLARASWGPASSTGTGPMIRFMTILESSVIYN